MVLLNYYLERYEKKKVGVARLKPTRYDNSKGTRIGLSLFIHQNYIANISNNYSITILFSTVPSS